MNYIERNISEELVHAYVDDNLSPDEHLRFSRLLEKDTELLEKVESYQAQNALLHDLFDPILEEPIPVHLKLSPSQNNPNNYLIKMVASLLLLCVGGLTGWLANDKQTQSYTIVANLAQTATRAHMVYTPEIKHPVEVTADQEQHLVKWLSKRLGTSINAPDLNSQGYALKGGRLLPSTTGPAAQFMYENSVGERLTLYVRTKNTNEKNIAFRYYEETGVNSFYWLDGELGYALVGNVSKTQLLDTANSVYQQLTL